MLGNVHINRLVISFLSLPEQWEYSKVNKFNNQSCLYVQIRKPFYNAATGDDLETYWCHFYRF